MIERGAEATLIAAVVRGDDGAAGVYADWLEQQGDLVRAEHVRVEDRIAGHGPETRIYNDGVLRLRELARTTDLEWRKTIARTRVAGCTTAGCATCWHQLAASDRPNTRTCGTCEQRVRYLASGEELSRAQAGARVVLDAAIARARRTIEHLADLPANAAWEGCALVVAAGATCAPNEPEVIEPLATLAASDLAVTFRIAHDDEPAEGWEIRGESMREPDEHWIRVARAAGIEGTLRLFASHDAEPGFLLAAWRAGDRGALLYRVWEDRGDEPRFDQIDTVHGWLRDAIDALLSPKDWITVTSSPDLATALRDTLAAAARVRASLREQRAARVRTIEDMVGVAGHDEEAVLREWERATAELERVNETPPSWEP